MESAVIRRNEIAAYYRQRLEQLPGINFQLVRSGNRCSFKDFSITIDAAAFGLTRDELQTVLKAENIDTRTYYDPPAHRQTAYKQYASPNGELVNTDRLSARILNLPIWSHMDEDIASRICLAIESAHELSPDIRRRLRVSVVQRSAGV